MNKITAQAQGAISVDSDVDTIFEIGGQDSRYISIEQGIVKEFEIVKVLKILVLVCLLYCKKLSK